MRDSRLISLLSRLGSSRLEKLDIDMPGDIISMDIQGVNDSEDKYKVTFEEVSSFYFINEEGKLIKTLELDHTQLNSIGYYKDGVGEFIYYDEKKDEITDEDVSYPNFAIEMKDTSIFIEAKSIRINDKRFRVGYPNI